MSKKISYANITDETIKTLSKYNVAYRTLADLRTEYRATCKKLDTEMEEIKKKRVEYTASGHTSNDAISKYSLEPVITKKNKAKAAYDEACEPYNENKNAALDLFSDNIYHAYKLGFTRGDFAATGKLVIKEKTAKNPAEVVVVEKSLKTLLVDFLGSIGASGQENDTAVNKFAQAMVVRAAGGKKCNKGDDYIVCKSSSQFKELLMLNLLQILVVEKGILTVGAGYEITKTIYE